MSKELIDSVEEHVQQIFKEHAPPENIYHNLVHTSEVVSASKEIAKEEGITDDELELIVIAAWFHDSGYVKICKGHEEISIEYAKEYPGFNYFDDLPGNIAKRIITTTDNR